VYKEWDVMLLSSLLEKASGISTYELCRKYLYQPLEIQSGIWGRSSCGIDYTIIDGMEDNSNLSARDLAKLGHLFLNLGCHQGNRILSENYIRQAISPSKGNESYGFLWWLFPGGYGCRGYGGQEISVIPEKNLVVVIQAKATPQCKSYGDVPRRLIELI
ncbi:MAG TPA: serine hydrolase, partial [Mobilitalea sp.]|nr:serine hydrolase [Mobilitalea sp.]